MRSQARVSLNLASCVQFMKGVSTVTLIYNSTMIYKQGNLIDCNPYFIKLMFSSQRRLSAAAMPVFHSLKASEKINIKTKFNTRLSLHANLT